MVCMHAYDTVCAGDDIHYEFNSFCNSEQRWRGQGCAWRAAREDVGVGEVGCRSS